MSTGENYGKFLDMLDLALMLQESSSGLSITEVMQHFNISRRTAERMRDALSNYFGGDFEYICEGTRKRFKLNSQRVDSLITFSKEELASFNLASKALRKNNMHSQADALDHAFLKLKSLSKPKYSVVLDAEDIMKTEGLALRPGPKMQYDTAVVQELRLAMMSFHQTAIIYIKEGKSTEHNLIPLGFLYGEHKHYLIARYPDDSKNNIFHFILNKIASAKILPATFEEDPSFNLEAYAARSFGVYQEEPFAVEWLFSPHVAEDASHYTFHPSQSSQRNPDGSLTVKFVAGGRMEMAWHLYTWADHVQVIQPADFWESLPAFR